MELMWREQTREVTYHWFEFLLAPTRYLSDLLGADVPITVPRAIAEAGAGVSRGVDADAALLGRAVRRSIAARVEKNAAATNEALLAELRALFAGRQASVVPPASLWLSTRDIAARLSIDEVTAARLCKRRLIDAEKTAGGQWRTTEDRLRRSPYLNSNSASPP